MTFKLFPDVEVKSDSKDKRESDCVRHAQKKCEIACCKKKYAKIAKGLLSTGLLASECKIDQIVRADRIDFKLQAILTTVMQGDPLDLACAGCSGAGEQDPVGYLAMVNSQWPNLCTWENCNPAFNEYLQVYRITYDNFCNRNWNSVEIVINDFVRFFSEEGTVQLLPLDPTTNCNFLTVANLPVPSPCAHSDEPSVKHEYIRFFKQISKQLCIPVDKDSSNDAPLVSNDVKYHFDGVEYDGKFATWRTSCPENENVNPFLYIAGYGIPACKKYCSPCVPKKVKDNKH